MCSKFQNYRYNADSLYKLYVGIIIGFNKLFQSAKQILLSTWQRVGLDKLFFFLPSQKVSLLFKFAWCIYPLFQFKDVTFILKRRFICGCIVALQKVKYNPLVLSFAFEKRVFQKRKYSSWEGLHKHNYVKLYRTKWSLPDSEGQIMPCTPTSPWSETLRSCSGWDHDGHVIAMVPSWLYSFHPCIT